MDKVLTPKRKTGLNGPSGLLAAVIAQATDDAVGGSGKKHIGDAWAYLAGDWYKKNLESLGLPNEWQPAALELMTAEELFNLADSIPGGDDG